jgi:hypothetical protein
MAVNVNTVYQTVLYILNKEQRGYVTPAEFNSLAVQVQNEIFESYFPDGNQINRINQNNTQNDTEFFNMFEDVSQKLTPFEQEISLTLDPGGFFYQPQISGTGSINRTIRKFGSLISTYIGQPQYDSITQLVSKSDYNKIIRSKLTSPTSSNPIYYIQKGTSTSSYLFINPEPQSATVNCVVYPLNPSWSFTVGSLNQYVYNPSTSIDFELDLSEQTNIIMKILKYCGVIVNDPNVINVASQEVAQVEANEKS